MEYALGYFGEGGNDLPNIYELPFFRNQQRIALRNCGLINPGDMEHYIARGGYQGLIRAWQMEPEEVIAEIELAGLKERGWAALSVAAKWALCRKNPLKENFLVVNVTENNAESYTSQLLLESDPHAVLEGRLLRHAPPGLKAAQYLSMAGAPWLQRGSKGLSTSGRSRATG